MSERYYLEDRYKIEGRLIFLKYLEAEAQTQEENKALLEYREFCEKIHAEYLHISQCEWEIEHYQCVMQTDKGQNVS